MRIMRSVTLATMGLAAVTLAGCADLQTVGRRTPLATASGPAGVAIHLDAQQRVVLYAGQKYCAEPSPDALAAYASALGLGIGIPGQGAGSAASALQSAAGSIGLRTQSITLMRDALYRMCEATNNGALSSLEVAAFLRRSQDLTAVVLAIEQLTGAVAANQVILTGNASADASANLVSNQQLLDQAKAREDKLKDELDEAETAVTTAKTKLGEAKKAEIDAKTALDNALKSDPNAEKAETKELQAKHKDAVAAREARDEDLADAEAKHERKKEQHESAKEVRESIEASRDAALTSASASTASQGQFSVVVPRKELSKEATQAIAGAVDSMVRAVLSKEYTADLCMSYLTDSTRTPVPEIVDICRQVLIKTAERGGVSIAQTATDYTTAVILCVQKTDAPFSAAAKSRLNALADAAKLQGDADKAVRKAGTPSELRRTLMVHFGNARAPLFQAVQSGAVQCDA